MYPFKKIVTEEASLQKLLGKPHSQVVDKTINKLDKHCKVFIARSPFLLVASADDQGNFDISPKGDPEGFVEILNENTLVIPERPGNRRADTFKNVLKNPMVGLIFFIPGKKESLRISGKATIIQDEDILETMSVQGKAPKIGLAVDVSEAFFHCAKCIVRSKLWSPESWPSLEGLPSLSQTMVDGANSMIPNKVMEVLVKRDEKKRLY